MRFIVPTNRKARVTELREGHIYFVDGGYFSAEYDLAERCWRLWVYAGLSGRVIGRTGFEVTDEGALLHRIFDFESEDFVLIAAGLWVGDLEEVDLPPTDRNTS